MDDRGRDRDKGKGKTGKSAKSGKPGPTKPAHLLTFTGDEIASLVESPQLVRWGGVDADHVHYLATLIAAQGQQTPVIVRRLPDSGHGHELIAGRHRRAAILRINTSPAEYGLPAPIPLLAVARKMSDESAIRVSFAENTGRPLTCMDLAHTAEALAAPPLDWPMKTIASVMSTPHHRISPSRVSQLRSLMRLPERIQAMLHAKKLPESVARAILRLGMDDAAMEVVADQLVDGTLRAGEIVAMANEARRDDGKKVKRTMFDLRGKLDEIGTGPAMDLLAWLDGEFPGERGDEIVEGIFAEAGGR